MTTTFEVAFDAKDRMLTASGPFRDGTLIVERIGSNFSARQISQVVGMLCGPRVAFIIGPSAEAWRAAFLDSGVTIAEQ